MKKLFTLSILGAALSLTACDTSGSANYTYEQEAPFAEERTVGTVPTAVVKTKKADPVFTSAQRK